MPNKPPSIAQALADLHQVARRELAAAGMGASRGRVRLGLRLQVRANELVWVPCSGAEPASHTIDVEIDTSVSEQTQWRVGTSSPPALGDASEAEQLEHRLREEFEQLADAAPQPKRKASRKKAAVKKAATKKTTAKKAAPKSKAKTKTKTKTKAKAAANKKAKKTKR